MGNNKYLNILLNVLKFILFFGLIILAVILFAFFIINLASTKKNHIPVISAFTIVSPSMEPNIKIYDIVINKAVKDDELKVDDIITFYSKDSHQQLSITHRIIEIKESNGVRRYYTKGDNNQNPDEGFITINDVIGKKIMVIPYVGKIKYFLTSKLGWFIVIFTPAIGIIIYNIKNLIKLAKLKEEVLELPEQEEIDEIRRKEQKKRKNEE